MRCVRQILLALVVVLSFPATHSAQGMTDGDRQRLLAHLQMTESWLLSEVAGLSEAQLRFRTKPDSWSIIDVVEHLSIAEPQYWNQLTASMKQPPHTGKLEATDASCGTASTARTGRPPAKRACRAAR
jgi:hypothetical protein